MQIKVNEMDSAVRLATAIPSTILGEQDCTDVYGLDGVRVFKKGERCVVGYPQTDADLLKVDEAENHVPVGVGRQCA